MRRKPPSSSTPEGRHRIAVLVVQEDEPLAVGVGANEGHRVAFVVRNPERAAVGESTPKMPDEGAIGAAQPQDAALVVGFERSRFKPDSGRRCEDCRRCRRLSAINLVSLSGVVAEVHRAVALAVRAEERNRALPTGWPW